MKFNALGPEGLIDRKPPGVPSRLDDTHRAALVAIIEQGPIPAIHGVVPKRDLVGNRYRFHPNCDIREVLNFTGSINSRQMRFNLDLACRAFGIRTSPLA